MALTEYAKEIQADYPACDPQERMKISDCMRYVQGIAQEHLEALGLNQKMLWEEGYVYLLTKVELSITRRPMARERLQLRTVPRQPKGALSYRDVFFEGQDGTNWMEARTAWALVNPTSHAVLRPSKMSGRIPIKPFEYDYTFGKNRIQRPTNAVVSETRKVRYSHLDVNRHMNNAVYSDFVCDAIPQYEHQTREWDKYTIHFEGEARLDEKLLLYTAQLENGWYVGADRPDGQRCFDALVHYKQTDEKER